MAAAYNLEVEVRNYIKIIEELLKELRKFKEDAVILQRNCNISTTVGVSVAGVGTTSLLVGWITSLFMAVPTGGISLIVAGGLTIGGAVAAAAGGITTGGTAITKHVQTKNMIDKVQGIQAKQLANAENIGKLTKILNIMTSTLIKRKRWSEEAAHLFILRRLRKGDIDLSRHDVLNQLEEILENMDEKEEEKFLDETINLVGHSVNVIFKTLAPFTLLVDDLVLAMSHGATFVVGEALVATAFRGVLAIAGVAFTGWETYRLVQSWKVTDPLVETIQDIISRYEVELPKIQNVLRAYLTIPAI